MPLPYKGGEKGYGLSAALPSLVGEGTWVGSVLLSFISAFIYEKLAAKVQ